MEPDDSIPLELGEFEIIRKLGQGVMGVVYEAFQRSQNHPIVLKTLSNGIGLTTTGISCFRQQLEAVARLKHSNIVAVDSSGELGLVPYYTMQLVEGPSLDRVIRRLKVEQVAVRHAQIDHGTDMSGVECPDWALRLYLPGALDSGELKAASTDQERSTHSLSCAVGETLPRFDYIAAQLAEVAEALAYAHDQGVLHGDLKPSNLLLGPDGRLSVADFGLARSLEQPGMTMGGEFLGSPYHMSPEQVSHQHHSADRHPVDYRTDIYALGVVLYELITLRKPFDGEHRDSVCDRILRDEVVPPTKLDSRIPQDLETICLKALEKHPDQRYQTAGQLADDLRRFAKHQGITAEPMGWWRQSTRWTRRHWVFGATTGLALLAAGFLGVLANQRLRAVRIAAAERLVRAISNASLVSMSGDEVATRTKLEEAEQLGAEAWVLSMLNGQLQLFSGHPADAIAPLEHALVLNPDSLAAQTLLESAFSMSGRLDDAQALESKLWKAAGVVSPDNLTVKDRLCLGSWLSRHDPRRGLAIVEQAKQDADRAESTLARLYLSQARWRLVRDTGDPTTAEEATREALLTRQLLRTNSLAWLVEFQTLRVAEVALRDAGHNFHAQLQDQAQEALGDIDKLFHDSPAAVCAWNWQAHFLDDPAERLQAFNRAIDVQEARQAEVPSSVRQAYAMELYLQDALPQATQELQLLRASNANFCEILNVILLVESGANVQAAQEELSRWPTNSGMAALYRPLGLLMLGKAAEARKMFSQLKPTAVVPAYRDGWYQRLLEYCCGNVSTEEFVAPLANPDWSTLDRNEGHFFVGMHLLADGFRDEAKQHFEKCIRAGVFTSREYQTSRTVLKKLEANPDWPSWIPESSSET